MKIAVLGNCQASMVQLCAGFLTGLETVHFTHEAFNRLFADEGEAALALALAPFDLVLSQSFGVPGPNNAGNDIIRAHAQRYVGLPNLEFSAFHPDIVYAATIAGDEAQSPTGAYHSALALYGFRAGLTVAQTLSLFRRDVFQHLGFFDQWQPSQKYFNESCRTMGFPGRELLAGWTRQGLFFYTINHPKLFVVEDIARTALRLAGVPTRSERCTDYLHDGFLNVVWPVYPEIAAPLSLPGSYMFRRTSFAKGPADRFPTHMDLDTFVRGSFSMYEMYGRDNLTAPKVDRWLADGSFRDVLRPV